MGCGIVGMAFFTGLRRGRAAAAAVAAALAEGFRLRGGRGVCDAGWIGLERTGILGVRRHKKAEVTQRYEGGLLKGKAMVRGWLL